MQFKHVRAAVSAVFDDQNLVSLSGLVPVMRLAEAAGLRELARERLTIPTDKGANAGSKVAALVAGMVVGADSIDDMNVLRHGGMRSLFSGVYAPSTLGSFLRAFTFGHVRQLDATASRLLANLTSLAPLFGGPGTVFVDVDDSVIEVHGHQKQAAGFGYTHVRGLNALIATATSEATAPVIVASRLRRGRVNSPRGAGSFIAEAVSTVKRLPGTTGRRVLVRADSGFYTRALVSTALRNGAHVSVTVKNGPSVRAAIDAIDEAAWTRIEYPNAIYDPDTEELISDAEVAEIDFVAFTGDRRSRHPGNIPGRLVVRRVRAHQDRGLFDFWRHHAFFTTVPASQTGTIEADQIHRAHAIIEQVHGDLKAGPLAHLPSGKFAANAAWLALATIAFNLTRTAAVLADTGGRLAKATTATIRRTLITIPARIARSARRVTLHAPRAWPWEPAFMRLFTAAHAPPAP